MKWILPILLFVSLAVAVSQPMVYNRSMENYESNSPVLVTNQPFDSGELPANSGWSGEWKLYLRMKGDTLWDNMLLSYLVSYYVTYGGIATGFSFPTGSTLYVKYQYARNYRGFLWQREWLSEFTSNVVDVGDSVKAHGVDAITLPVTYASSPTARSFFFLYNLTNGGQIPPFTIESYPTTGNPPIIKQNLDTVGVLTISFRIDIGETAGHLKLRWSTLFWDPTATPVYPARGDDFGHWQTIVDEETEEVTHVWVPSAYSGTPSFSTTVLRGSTLTAFKLY